jgi:hypothetical protein
LPSYPLPDSSFIYKLGYIRYPPWNYKCRQSEQFNLEKTANIFSLNDISNVVKIGKYLSIFFIVLFGFFLAGFYIIRKLN